MAAALSESTATNSSSPHGITKGSSLTSKKSLLQREEPSSAIPPAQLNNKGNASRVPTALSKPSGDKETSAGILKKFKRFLVKISINLTLFFTKLRFIADQVLDSDEITGELFNRTDSTSVNSSLYEPSRPFAAIPEDKMVYGSHEGMVGTENLTNDDLLNINIQREAERLRSQHPDTPFTSGDRLWELQNKQWLIPVAENATINGKLKLQKRMQEKELKHVVMPKDYSIVYKSLVIDNKRLKTPMCLKDLLKVIEAGWHWNKVWENAGQGVQ
ncbi:unnamed protein product [Kuraishia capsulata CBS 1993]|uniref:Gag1-like clamp domain-containing protein n=1 Tax=Kuraishia capsulata CBS 1993 TaxID=1382522 RepID=W6MG51_9ASCO|nr:uncharacterized protein KUCA_T00000672001 [Kuraishia capsulata CBS 1993]CDK24706.1 unnamed protein product [Kuraishia capsulata CBS 1993]